MDIGNRITQIEDEVKVLKNEMLAVLLDVKETLLNRENPFNTQPRHEGNGPNITINQGAAAAQAAPPPPTAVEPEPEPEPEHELEAAPAAEAADYDTAAAPIGAVAVEDDEDSEDADDEEADPEQELLELEITTPENARGNGNGRNHGNGHGNGQGLENGDNTMMSKQGNAQFSKIINTIMEPEGGKQWQAAAEDHDGGQRSTCIVNDRIDLQTLFQLGEWVVATADQIGPENTQYILDVSEMAGHLPSELKATMEKMIPANLPAKTEDKIAPKVYLKALNQLALLLGQENASDFIVFHIASQGLSSLSRNG